MFSPLRLQQRIVLLIGILMFFIIVSTSFVISFREERTLKEHAYKKMYLRTSYMARRMGNLISNSNWRSLQLNLNKDLICDNEMIYYFITDIDGKILLAPDHSVIDTYDPQIVDTLSVTIDRPEQMGNSSLADEIEGFSVSEILLRKPVHFEGVSKGRKGETVFDTSWDIVYFGDKIATLRVGFSKKPLLKKLSLIKSHIFIAGGVNLALILAAIFVVVRSSVRPLNVLSEEISGFGNSDDSISLRDQLEKIQTLEIQSSVREIDNLKNAFNKMKNLLIIKADLLEEHKNSLEETVRDRTGKLTESNKKLQLQILERKRAERDLKRQNAYLDALNETTLGLIGSMEFSELINAIISRAGSLTGMENGYLFMYDEENDSMRMEVGSGLFMAEVNSSVNRGAGLVGTVWEKGVPVVVDDYCTWSSRLDIDVYDNMHYVIGIPLKYEDRIMGVLGFGDESLDKKLGDDEIDILCRFAELSSVALANANLHAKLQKQLNERQRMEEENREISFQLLQAQKLEAIGKMAGGIAHDMNNLLMAIQGNLSLMRLNDQSAENDLKKRRNIENLIRSGANLTRQLLGFARGGECEVAPFNPVELVKRNISMFGRTRKAIHIHEYYEKNIWTVEVDKGQIDQILLNLFVNAADSMPEGGDINISVTNELLSEPFVKPYNIAPGKFVKISVEDAGCGIAPEDLDKVFDPFFTTKEMGRGTGLGLASVYGIVKKHGGMVAVRSRLGHGTCFDLYFPYSDKMVSDTGVSDKAAVSGSGTVLLIDDEEVVREVTGEFINELGYTCISAENGEEGVEIYQRLAGRIDLVILDMVMPGMSGAETSEVLTGLNPQVKILFASGYTVNDSTGHILKLSEDDNFIQKPFSISKLSHAIRRMMTHDNGRAAE